jgi:biopolymer transport protein ExbD
MHSDHSGNGNGMHEVNVVPLIDVSLVLVVILMLLTPLASESNIAVQRTHAASEEVAEEPAEPLVIAIPDETDVFLNRTRVARSELSAALAPLLAVPQPPPVVVTCEDGVSHGAFVNVLDQAKLSGAEAIAVAQGVE